MRITRYTTEELKALRTSIEEENSLDPSVLFYRELLNDLIAAREANEHAQVEDSGLEESEIDPTE